jgi:O-antigen/teichoic acid export membrane protein
VRRLTTGDPENPASIGDRVVVSARWLFSLRVGSIVSIWVVSIVLAHLLEKRQYGLAGMANIFVGLLLLFQESGLSSALIHRRDAMREAVDSAVLYAAVSGVTLAIVSFAAAPLVGGFFHQHVVTNLVRGFSLLFLFRAVSQVPLAVLQKELRFREYTQIMLSGSVIQTATAITAAVLGAGAWSPLAGAIALEAWCAVLTWPVSGLRADPRRASWRTLRELLAYGRGPAGASVMQTMTQYVDNAVIARQLGPASLGAYGIGYQVGKQPLNTVIYATNQLVFPAYSQLRDEPERFRRAYLRSIRFLSIASAPLAFGLAAASGTFIDAIYGARWHAAAPVVTIIVLMTLVLTLASSMGEVMKALSRPGWVFPLAVLQFALVLAAVLVLYPHGITAVAAGVAVGSVIVTIVATFMTEHLLRIGWREWVGTPLPALVAGATMGAVLLAANAALHDTTAGIRLCIDTVVALGVYFLVLRIIAPKRLAEFREEAARLTGVSRLRQSAP